ncbi:MAG: hypothetical protein DWQ01_19180 [Planctomycetota bacterium]|nr:MAG: hypothetical protein DWQ01_19180 [Planctomycetota bacterium]
MSAKKTSLIALLFGVVLFVAVNLLSREVLRAARWDLTEQKLYTLSEGSANICRQLKEPVRLRFFYSENLASQVPPQFKNYADRVRELLEEYVALADGKLVLEVFDPEPFTEEEDQAVGFGLAGQPINARNDQFFLGLVGTNTVDDEEVIPFLSPGQEASLEYDISRLVHTLSHPGDKQVVGLISALPLEGGQGNPFQPASPGWGVVDLIKQQYELRNLGLDFDSVDPEVDVLLLIHPKNLSPQAQYAVDQFVMGGGHVLAFIDPHSEQDRPMANPQNPLQGMNQSRASDLGPLLAAWGLEMATDKLVGDLEGALEVTAPTERGPQRMRYLLWFSPREDAINADDFATAGLQELRFATAGALEKRADFAEAIGDGAKVESLIASSREAQRIEEFMVRFNPDPEGLLQKFASENRSFDLAVRVSGTLPSAFSDGPPPKPETPEEDPEADEAVDPEPETAHLAASEKPTNIIVVSDTDMLTDNFSLRIQNFMGQRLMSFSGQNASFLLNALENLLGSNDLISLRARGNFRRPFEVVEDLQKEAQERYYLKEQEIELRIQEAEQRLQALQFQEVGEGYAILSPEQEGEIETLNQELLGMRKERRDIRHELDKDVQRLMTKLKALNMGAVPLGVLLIGAALWLLKSVQRSRR